MYLFCDMEEHLLEMPEETSSSVHLFGLLLISFSFSISDRWVGYKSLIFLAMVLGFVVLIGFKNSLNISNISSQWGFSDFGQIRHFQPHSGHLLRWRRSDSGSILTMKMSFSISGKSGNSSSIVSKWFRRTASFVKSYD
jgi:hypothetical protein